MYSMHQHVYDYIQTCTKCQRIKNQKHGHNGPSPLTSMSIEDPFDRWHIDCLKLHISKTTESHHCLLLVDDSLNVLKWWQTKL